MKTGPVFFESISSGNIKSRKDRSGYFSKEFLNIIPYILLVLIFSFFVIRLFYLQIIRGSYYSRLSDENRVRTSVIPAGRGIFFDKNGKPLVSNSPAFKVIDKDKKVKFVTQETALELLAKGAKNIENDIQRNYLHDVSFSHVLGYTGQISEDEIHQPDFDDYGISDFIGKMGLEKQYEKILHGKNGQEIYEVDATGKRVRFLGKDEPIPGQNIKTTLDLDLQLAINEAMQNVAKGAVIATDPRDGSVRAIYSKPTFDPNLFTHAQNYKPRGDYKNVEQILEDEKTQPLLDRAISGVYPPGSTYKLISAAGALQNGAITEKTVYEDTGVLKVGAFSFGNWFFIQHGRKEGPLDVVGALKRSNDIFFYKAAEELGVTDLARWSRRFGMGKLSGIDLPHEAKGTVPDPAWKKEVIGEQWYLGDTYNMGIGQGFLLSTPLQVNIWTMPFANEGVIYKPHLVDGEKSILQKEFLDKKNIDLVRRGMLESCQTGGVAWPFFSFGVKNKNLVLDGRDYMEMASGGAKLTKVTVGCKTGTAESGDEETLPHAWITVVAPFYKPELVLTVLVENSGEGSSIAGPIARKILEEYFEKR